MTSTTANLSPVGFELTVGTLTFAADAPRSIVADALEEAGHEELASVFRADESTDTMLDDLFSVNGQPDEDEPWTAGDDCPTIDIRGEDLVVLCEDGVARWTNTQRAWSEVSGDASAIYRLAEDIYWSFGRRNAADVLRFLLWVAQFSEIDSELVGEILARLEIL